MALRSSGANVKNVIDTTLSASEIEASQLKTANRLVTEHLTGSGVSVSSDLLEEVEMYLAAHFVALKDPQVEQESAMDTRRTYQGKTGMKLDLTWWGQMAQSLDPTGNLASLNKKRDQASITVLSHEDL